MITETLGSTSGDILATVNEGLDLLVCEPPWSLLEAMDRAQLLADRLQMPVEVWKSVEQGHGFIRADRRAYIQGDMERRACTVGARELRGPTATDRPLDNEQPINAVSEMIARQEEAGQRLMLRQSQPLTVEEARIRARGLANRINENVMIWNTQESGYGYIRADRVDDRTWVATEDHELISITHPRGDGSPFHLRQVAENEPRATCVQEARCCVCLAGSRIEAASEVDAYRLLFAGGWVAGFQPFGGVWMKLHWCARCKGGVSDVGGVVVAANTNQVEQPQ